MIEADYYQVVIDVVEAGLKRYPLFKDVDVRQAYNPRITGAPTGSSVLLSNINTHRYGFLKRESKYRADLDPPREVRTETQQMFVTLQANAQVLLKPSPATGPGYTAGDLLVRVSSILQGDDGRLALQVGGVGVTRITTLRPPYLKNDQDQFQASPSFDFDLNFANVDEFDADIINSYVFRQARV